MGRTSTINFDGSFFLNGLESGTANLSLGDQDRNLLKGFTVSRIERDGIVQPRGIEIVSGDLIEDPQSVGVKRVLEERFFADETSLGDIPGPAVEGRGVDDGDIEERLAFERDDEEDAEGQRAAQRGDETNPLTRRHEKGSYTGEAPRAIAVRRGPRG